MSSHEIKSEPLGEEVEGDALKSAEDITNICFDYEDQVEIPIKEEIKKEIKTEDKSQDWC